MTTIYSAARKNLKSVFDTAYLLSNPGNARHIKESLFEFNNGETTSYDLDEL